METKEMKICATCGRELPVTMFARNHYGVAKSCKECNGKKIANGKAYKNKVALLQKGVGRIGKLYHCFHI